MSDFRFEWQDSYDGDRLAAAQELASKKEPSLSATFKAAFESESLTRQIFQSVGGDDMIDPGYRMDPQWLREQMEARGIPEEYSSIAGNAMSQRHAELLLDRAKGELDAKSTLAQAGWTGVGAQVLVGMTDPATLIASIGPGGAAAWAHKGRALATAVRAAVAGGASNAAVEAALAGSQLTRDPEDVFHAAVTGFALGGALGGTAGLLTKSAQDLFHNTTLRRAARDLGHDEPGFASPSQADNPIGSQPRAVALREPPREGEVLDPESGPVVPHKPAPELERPIIEGEYVEWDMPDGTVQKGRMVGQDPETKTMFIEDEDGALRRFRSGPEDPDAPSRYLGGSIGSGQIGQIDEPASRFAKSYLKLGPIKIPIRFDAFSYFERTGNTSLRRMAGLLVDDPMGKEAVKDATGKKHFVENQMAATEYAEMEFKRHYRETHHAFEEGWAEYHKARGLTVAQRISEERAFAKLVSQVTRDTSGELARANPEAAKVAKRMAEARTSMLRRMQELGVEGADEVAENAHYLNRRYDWDKVARMTADPEMRGRLYELIAGSIRKVRPEIDEARAKQLGKTFINRLRDVQTDKTNLGFLSDGGFNRLANELRHSGHLDEQEIEDILGHVFSGRKVESKGDSAAHPRLKKRAFLDEAHAIKWTDADGKARTLRFDDLLENDVRVLNQLYFKQTAGLTAMARKGVRSRKDYDTLREAARQEGVDNGTLPEKLNKQLEDMDRVARYLLGQPMYEGPSATWAKGLRILRNFNVITNLAQVGFAQMAESGQLMSLKATMAMRTNMSAYDGIINQLKKGKADSDLLRDLRAMGAIAEDSDLRRPFLKEYDAEEAALGRADDAAALGSHYTLKASGMHYLTEFQREKIAKMYSQRLLNIAVGAEKLDDGLKARLATNGLADDALDEVLEAYKKHVRVSDDGTAVGVDYDAWEASSRKTFDAFRLAVHRESHRSIQEVSLGAAPLWMHTETGKLLFQFRSFVMNAWTKQTLYAAAHADMQTLMTFAFSTMAGGLAYAAQTYVNFANNDDELAKRLDPVQIALAAFQRAGMSSLIPMGIDTAMDIAMGDPVFKFGRTSNLASGFVLGIPAVAAGAKATGLLSAAAQDAFTDDHVWTQKEFGYGTGFFPQFVGLRAAFDTMKQEFPRSNPLRRDQQ